MSASISPSQLELDPTAVKEFAEEFERRLDGTVARLSSNIQVLADVVWRQDPGQVGPRRGVPSAFASAWDHLLLSVANFKRQRWVDTQTTLEVTDDLGAHVREEIVVPLQNGRAATIRRDDPAVGEVLATLRGFGSPPTGSALLAALWPQHHLIIDRRAYGVALVLDPGAGRLHDAHSDEFGSQQPIQPLWRDYLWYRHSAILTAQAHGLALSDLERAFYIADEMVESPDGRTWDQYREIIHRQVGVKFRI